jgi:putative endonuclease
VPDPPKRFVYIIVSVNHPERRYVGVTADVTRRLAAHNAGQNRSTVPWRPWRLLASIAFEDEPTAARFERYLKTGSGRTFALRHFCPVNDDAR